ncbi:uncharacterized protein LOC130590992 isoform X1 [Beta vulgaris subsp. vulgaris]|uniref:uncharacterized protein LOC130590992 isoform X1 n=1 Tax=Beta vulgaris subsp. vulgaris TaxID=3555 RepID=UPI0025489B9A|nr:uncharacterized protein LOC130590992 isoform X1 [Beta vulgaris subsp. vulgaris]
MYNHYPTIASTTTSGTSSTTTVAQRQPDRALDWWCSMHGVDAKGQRVIPDPATKQIANAIIGLKEKEATGEFTPRGQVDALHETLGWDEYGRVRGVGGVRLGVRKVYGDQFTSTSRSSASSVNSAAAIDMEAMKAELREELRAEMTQNFNAILAQMGLPTFGAFPQGGVPAQPVPTQPHPYPEFTVII